MHEKPSWTVLEITGGEVLGVWIIEATKLKACDTKHNNQTW